MMHPLEALTPSKVCEFDETLLVGDPWLVAVLKSMRPRSLSGLNDRVMGVEPVRFSILFQCAQSLLRIPQYLWPQQLYVI